ncbi:MAG TPA: LysR family transcriptional regulator [Luteolibacter sp.]|nr:LysR family transcriptional regulator [Luteolibacter sp.]
MNVHHLELFYHVAKHEGITAAIRKMPFGIQQPAVSGQLLQLEHELGVKLFNRRPFALTPAGEKLYDFVYPFLSRLEDVESRVRGEERRHLRIAASASVFRHHLPDLLAEMRAEEPGLRLSLSEVEPSKLHGLLASQQVDLAVGILHGRLGEGLKAVELLKLPLVLLVPESWPIRRFSDLLEDDPQGRGKTSKYPLVGLTPDDMVSRIFQEALEAREVNWLPSVEATALDVIEEYAARGFGVGLGVAIPGRKPAPGLRMVKLTGFPPVVVGAICQGTPKPLAASFLDKARKRAKTLGGKKTK